MTPMTGSLSASYFDPQQHAPVLHYRGQSLDMRSPVIMGILNVTPDSFSDGGKHQHFEPALQAARQMIADGAAIIDVGGESTRPGAKAVSEKEEIRRTVPLVEALCAEGILVSVDTSKAEVMRASAEAGAFMINDVRALREPGALDVVARSGIPVCLMHMQGEPRTMQHNPAYDSVVDDVIEFLRERLNACRDAGIDAAKVILDPGFGFGKTLRHNLCLLQSLDAFFRLNAPILVGLSRKSLFGHLLDLEVQDRLLPSVVGAVMAVERGARIVRVHDVRETAQAMTLFNAVQNSDQVQR